MVNVLLRWVTPNQLTLARIFSIPALLVLIGLDRPLVNNIAFGVFTVSCLTDYWDGLLARERGEVTQLGKLLDPIADKMLILSSLILLVSMGIAAVIPTILITAREFAVGGLRSVAAADGVVISSAQGAKYKTLLQMLATGFLIMHHDPWSIPSQQIGVGMLWIAAVWTLWTGYGYYADYIKIVFKK